MKFLVLILFFVSACCSAGDARNVALLGTWKCGPYSMVGDGFETTATETSTYQTDGSYRGTTELSVRLASGKVVNTTSSSFGSWSLKDDIIEISYDKVEFLSSDEPTYTVEMGQADADAQLKKKNWSKSRILELDGKLTTVPVESMYKGAEVEVTCVRP
jgi:hypothetical protein